MDAILPAAGEASRMRGIPKFLLPCDSNFLTLLEYHVNNLLNLSERIWIPTRPQNINLINSLNIAKRNVIPIPMETATMSETVLRIAELAKAENYFLAMPDTYYSGENPYQKLNYNTSFANLACWEIRDEQKGKLGQVQIIEGFISEIVDKDPNCDYKFAWGALTFNKNLLDFVDETSPHIGFSIKNSLLAEKQIEATAIKGKYYDCGTPSEYLDLLRNEL